MRRAYRFEGYDVEPPTMEERERRDEERHWAECEKCDNRHEE